MRKLAVMIIIMMLGGATGIHAQGDGTCPPIFDGSVYILPRLVPTIEGVVLPGGANRVRSTPSTNGEIVGEIPVSGEFQVIDGPSCSEGIVWWQIESAYANGWTAESLDGEYYLAPISAPPLPSTPPPPPDATLPGGALMLKSSAGGVLLVAPSGKMGEVDLWDVDTGSSFQMQLPHDADPILGQSNIIFFAENESETVYVTGDSAGRAFVWSADLTPLGNVEPTLLAGYLPAYTTDEKFTRMAVGGCFEANANAVCTTGAVNIFDIDSQATIASLRLMGGTVTAVDFSADGSLLAAATSSGLVRVWNLRASGEPFTFQVPGAVADLAFNPTIPILAIGYCIALEGDTCLESPIQQVSITDGSVISELPSHRGAITSLDIDASGQRIVSAGTDGVLRVRDLGNNQLTHTFLFDANDVVFFSEFNELAAGNDTQIAIWSLES